MQETDGPTASSGPTESDDDAGAYQLDGNLIRSVLDTGTDAVLGLHREVTEITGNGGLTVEVGNPTGGGGA
jgi:hypothetical protein